MIEPLLLTCVGVAHDLPLLRHWVAHYRGLGIAPDRIRVLLNATDPNDPGLAAARDILRAEGIDGVEDWIATYTSDAMWTARRDLQRRHAGPDDWVLSADVDELHAYPAPLRDFLAECDRRGINAVQGPFVDRLAPGGRLAPVEATPGILEQFPVAAEVAWSIAGKGEAHGRSGTIKLMAMRGNILPHRGGHHPMKGQDFRYLYHLSLGRFDGLESADWRFRVPTRVYHLHWTDTLIRRLQIRLATPGVSPAGREYGQKQLDHFAQHGGVSLDHVAVAPEPDDRAWTAEVARIRRTAWMIDIRGRIRRRLGR
ncbi:MAG: glycosyltransferase family 2 protein [Pseudomonadota bacterium]